MKLAFSGSCASTSFFNLRNSKGRSTLWRRRIIKMVSSSFRSTWRVKEGDIWKERQFVPSAWCHLSRALKKKSCTPSLLSWRKERWTTVRRCCSSWRWWAGESWAVPRAQVVCSAAAFLSAGLAVGPGSVCSEPGSAYSGGSSYGGLRLRSCTSNESGEQRESHRSKPTKNRESSWGRSLAQFLLMTQAGWVPSLWATTWGKTCLKYNTHLSAQSGSLYDYMSAKQHDSHRGQWETRYTGGVST